LSRFVPFPRVERGEAESAATSGLEWRQEQGAELEVLAPGITDDANQFDGLAVAWVAAIQFVFPLANALGNPLQGLFEAMAHLFFEEMPLEGAQALDLFDGFVMPAAEGGPGHVELGGDGVKREALGAEWWDTHGSRNKGDAQDFARYPLRG
jgi:hypothetical protein